MIDLEQFYPLKRRPLSSLLGLALDGSRLDGVVLRRTNGSIELQQSFSVTLALDPLTADPELVSQEIRNHLDAAGVTERHCAVCLPLKWAISVHVELPDLPEADIVSFLAIEAERGFPCDVATLRLAGSRCGNHATQIGLPASQLLALERVLRGAKLRPLSFSIGIATLQPPDAPSSDGVVALAFGETHLDLQITSAGGVVAWRALDGAFNTESGQPVLDAEFIARELRITLGQLPAGIGETIRRVRIFGPPDLARQLTEELNRRLGSLGLEIDVVSAHTADEFDVQLPPDAPVSRAFGLAARLLARRESPFEFLPPPVTVWHELAARYSSGKLRTVAAISLGVLLLVGGPFLYQQIHLMILRSRWAAISAKAGELDDLQQKIRQYRPWFDHSCRSLNILRQMTLAFPEDGAVSVKMLEIHDGNVVTCSGVARDNASLLRTLSTLRSAPGVADLKVDQIRGTKTIQFSFDFHWEQGGKHED